MSQNLSAKHHSIRDKPVEFIKNYFAQLGKSQTEAILSNEDGGEKDEFPLILERELGIEGSLNLKDS